MADGTSRRDLEEELRVAQAEVAQLRAENQALQSIAKVVIGELTEEQFRRARMRLEQLDAGEEADDEPGADPA